MCTILLPAWACVSLNNFWKSSNKSFMKFISRDRSGWFRAWSFGLALEIVGSILGVNKDISDRSVLRFIQTPSEITLNCPLPLLTWFPILIPLSNTMFKVAQKSPHLCLTNHMARVTARQECLCVHYNVTDTSSFDAMFFVTRAETFAARVGSSSFHISAIISHCCYCGAHFIFGWQRPTKRIVWCCRVRTGYWSGW